MARSRVLVALCVVYALTMAGVVASAITGLATADQVTGPVMVVFGVVAVGFSARAARQPSLVRPVRRAAAVVTGALVLALATPLIFLATGPKSFPAPGDDAHLAFVVVLFVAVQLLPLREATRRERTKTLLDAGILVVGAGMVLSYGVIGPVVSTGHGSLRNVLAASTYPVVDLLVLFGFARALLRGTDQGTRRPLGLLGGAMFFYFLGDAYLGYAQAHVDQVARTPWQFACWLTTHFLLACGAVEFWRQVTRPSVAPGVDRGNVAGKLRYAGIGVGYLLMAVAAHHEPAVFPWTGLVLGGIGITGLVVARQLMVQREISEAAETDALTGLANRARLRRELSRALPGPPGPVIASRSC